MDHTDDTNRKMRESNPSPTTASASEPRSPTTNDDPRGTGDDINSRSATSTSNPGTRSTTTIHDARLRNLAIANRATYNVRKEYHARQAEALRQRIGALQIPLVLTEEHVNVLTKRGLQDLVRICRTIESCGGISQEDEIKFLEERLADIKYVEYMDEMLECIK
ncbi:hypothetical protein N0V85_007577 [Neurospora sp. IMI 360204]|nr:hypothetical protein N0V85_007577 [Neurospora sp. IMI 360204]